MTTKDQLDPLFRAEIERMMAHLDDIAFAVRQSGAVDDVREMEADIEVGWAYRLIQLFGKTRLLTLEANCAGRRLLLRHGIPEPHIAPIDIPRSFVEDERCAPAIPPLAAENFEVNELVGHGSPDGTPRPAIMVAHRRGFPKALVTDYRFSARPSVMLKTVGI